MASEAKPSRLSGGMLDRRVASLLAMTAVPAYRERAQFGAINFSLGK
jgi:hypothetical protein